MWKYFIHTSWIFALSLLSTSCSEDKVIAQKDIPFEISSYIEEHFPEHEILQISKDENPLKSEYKIILSDNITLEFNGKNEVVEINSAEALPASVIPPNIKNYTQTNYPSSIITDWEKDNHRQQVKLDNHLELIFDQEGNFIRIDD